MPPPTFSLSSNIQANALYFIKLDIGNRAIREDGKSRVCLLTQKFVARVKTWLLFNPMVVANANHF
ncbi:hypothetical protein PGT21_013297 [Puccinia graminis f. sp. tritici]|uniref:Uncharacterized protein n=1 Tax=Puccinia graminis f. sp. tritici TaxID=56615 RepID=A0A5B0MEK2_PUCGR|nr:hypothetical protein PGT21_013297 [Puccinia graminis f. sp. tritici]